MEYLKNFKKSCLKRPNARMFNSDLDLYYTLRDIRIVHIEREIENKTDKGDLVISFVTEPKLLANFDIYTSVESIQSNAQPLNIKTLKDITISPAINIGDLGGYVLSVLKEEYPGSEIITVDYD